MCERGPSQKSGESPKRQLHGGTVNCGKVARKCVVDKGGEIRFVMQTPVTLPLPGPGVRCPSQGKLMPCFQAETGRKRTPLCLLFLNRLQFKMINVPKWHSVGWQNLTPLMAHPILSSSLSLATGLPACHPDSLTTASRSRFPSSVPQCSETCMWGSPSPLPLPRQARAFICTPQGQQRVDMQEAPSTP